MSRLLLWLFLALCASTGRADDYADANAAYAAGNFSRARQGYERVLGQGHYANAWFNFGNASFRLNEAGRAALAYERALLAEPTHPEATANLRLVRDKTGARIQEGPWLEKVWRYVAQPATAWLLIGEAWLGFALLTMTWAGRKSRVKLVGGMFFVLMGLGGIAALSFARAELATFAIVVRDRAEARTEPADRAAVAQALGAGSRVRVISEQGDWTYCILPGDSRGWLPAKSVDRIIARGTL